MLVLIATDPESRSTAEAFKDRFELLTVTDTPVAAMEGETVLPCVKQGRALRLKTAFAYAFGKMNADGVITLPRGGCEPVYVQRVAQELENGAAFVDGGLHTPSPAYWGSLIRLLTTITTGSHRIPWCGLRGYSRQMLPVLENENGQHDDYEITVLQAAVDEGIQITDITCEKNEDGGAAAPHVSARNGTRAIWGIFRHATSLKFLCSSMTAFLIDFVLLLVLADIMPFGNESSRVAVAQAISWIISSQYNFTVNHYLVFRKKSGFWKAMVQYYTLAIFVFLGKFGLLQVFITFLPLSLSKILCEVALFVVNYIVQKKLIFSRKTKES